MTTTKRGRTKSDVIFELTEEQEKKLRALEKELSEKKKRADRLKKVLDERSEKTGVRHDLVDTDVFGIAVMLGFIDDKDILEGKKPKKNRKGGGGGLIAAFFGAKDAADEEDGAITRDLSKMPIGYTTLMTEERVTEKDKTRMISERVRSECEAYIAYVDGKVNAERDQLARSTIILDLNPDVKDKRNEFIKLCVDAVNNLLFSNDDEEDDEDEDSVDETICNTRYAMLGLMPLLDYKRELLREIEAFRTKYSRAPKYLSNVDRYLVLHPRFHEYPLDAVDESKLLQDCVVRSYVRDPKLRPFDIDAVTRSCLVPSVFGVDVKEILRLGILSPYLTSSFGYVLRNRVSASTPKKKVYYLLTNLLENGDVRVWTCDADLTRMTEEIRRRCGDYCVEIFRSMYRRVFGHNDYHRRENIERLPRALLACARNIFWLYDSKSVREFFLDVAQPIIPTSRDVFNYQFIRDSTTIKTSFFTPIFDDLDARDDADAIRGLIEEDSPPQQQLTP